MKLDWVHCKAGRSTVDSAISGPYCLAMSEKWPSLTLSKRPIELLTAWRRDFRSAGPHSGSKVQAPDGVISKSGKYRSQVFANRDSHQSALSTIERIATIPALSSCGSSRSH